MVVASPGGVLLVLDGRWRQFFCRRHRAPSVRLRGILHGGGSQQAPRVDEGNHLCHGVFGLYGRGRESVVCIGGSGLLSDMFIFGDWRGRRLCEASVTTFAVLVRDLGSCLSLHVSCVPHHLCRSRVHRWYLELTLVLHIAVLQLWLCVVMFVPISFLS
jgi:hypothetical protein